MRSSYKISKRVVPMIPLRGMWILPGITTSFDAGRDLSKEAIDEAKIKDSYIFLSTQKDPTIEDLDKKI